MLHNLYSTFLFNCVCCLKNNLPRWRSKGLGLLMIVFGSLLIFATSVRAENITSAFGQDAEGWTVVGEGEGPQYLTAGLPQGFICAKDTHSYSDHIWQWKAPLVFSGNLSTAYGKALTFELKSSSSTRTTKDNVFLVGADLTLVFDLHIAPGTDWTTYRVPLDETAGWRTTSGDIPTATQMKAVLASVSDLRIRGNYTAGSSSECLDNVVLETIAPLPPTQNIVSTFNNDNQGWVPVDEGNLLPFAPSGIPQGFICAKDAHSYSDHIWDWKAPLAFSGNLIASYGKALTFELKTSERTTDTDYNVHLVGAGLTLVFNLDTAPGTSWTAYRVPLHETAGWQILSASGGVPSAAQMQAVLASVTDLFIRGNYTNGSSSECLDNVVLEVITPERPTKNIVSNFSINNEGWVPVHEGDLLAFAPSGIPQGFICTKDTHSYSDHIWDWKAPLAFSGNLTEAYNKFLSFDLRTSKSGGNSGSDIRLVGNNLALVFDTGAAPSTEWSHYSVLINENAGWRIAGDTYGQVPTQAQLKAVLSSVTDLRIRGNYINGSASECLDNVVLEIADSSPPVTHSITATAGAGGVISPASTTVNHGATAVFTVTPDPNYTANVTGCGGMLSGNVYTTNPITADCTVSASFTVGTAYTLTVVKTGTGDGMVGGNGNYAAGAMVTLTATPATGSIFTSWSPSPCASRFTMPANHLTCTATFTSGSSSTYPVTVVKAGTGSGMVSGDGYYASGATVTLAATPATGSIFTGWNPSPCANLFTMPANALTCIATFTAEDSATTLITHYYNTILRRGPDERGLVYWQQLIADKRALGLDVKIVFRDMANFFFNSTEYVGRKTTNNEFITNLYLTFFDREPDEGGMSFWLGQLAGSTTRTDAMNGFLYSPEFTKFMADLGL